MLPAVMRLAVLFITQVMTYRGKWYFYVALLLKVTADNNCVIFLVSTSPYIQITGKEKFCSFQYMCPMVSVFYYRLIST